MEKEIIKNFIGNGEVENIVNLVFFRKVKGKVN